MIDRRLLLAVLGVVLGVLGAVAALIWTPGAAVVSAAGALLAGGAVLLKPASMPGGSTDAPPVVEATPADAEPARSDQLATAAAPAPQPRPIAAAPTPPDAVANGGPVGATSTAPALTDPITGLFSQDYFDIAIDARIAAARRHLRPVGVVMLEVVEGLRVGRLQTTEPKRVAEAIQATLREADTACRRSDGRFALLLEDTPENGAIWTVERIRRFLAERDPTLTLWAGIACYPAHGFSSESLVKLATVALDIAREWRQDRIEVAVGE